MPEHMTVPVEWKAASGSGTGELEGYASVFGNVDRDGDVVMPGAFRKTLSDWSKSRQPLPLIADHDLSTAGVIGSVKHAEEDAVGLRVRAAFSSTAKAQDIRTKMIEGHLKGMSFTYQTVRHFMGQVGGKSARFLQELRLFEATVSPFPINELATASAKAMISTADQNNLPDSDFAYIEPGGTKDSSGRTTPRSLRHFPVQDAAHVRNALARASQSPFGKQAMGKIRAAAAKFGVDVSESAAMDFTQWADAMQKALEIGVEPVRRAAAQLLVAEYSFTDFSAGLADEPPTEDPAASEGTGSKAADYASAFLVHLPEPSDGTLDPLTVRDNQRTDASLDELEARINQTLGRAAS